MKNKFAVVLFFTFMLFSTSAYAETFKGRVIDADTKEPIEGAVVVASWHESTATIAGGTSRFKDVKETLTDKNGEWKIRGPKGDRFIAQVFAMIPGIYYTESPEFIIFKPGYCSYRAGFGIKACKEKMKVDNFTNSDNIGEIVELPKLTKREDRLRAVGISPSLAGGDLATAKKLENFVRLLDKEERNLGLTGQRWIKELDAKVSNYLILNDIGPYKLSSKSEFMGIEFRDKSKDIREIDITTERYRDEAYHAYKAYKTVYIGSSEKTSPVVKVKEYDAKGRLMHNIEHEYRDRGWERLGLLIKGVELKLIDGNKIISLKGRRYSWASKNVVVEISCSESTKSEPIQVIQAYLKKFPSTIPNSLTFDEVHDKKWIKDEMFNRLTLSGYWFDFIRTGNIEKKKALKATVNNLNVFLDYRDRYFNAPSKNEKQLLQEHLNANDLTEIKKKITEYNKWWRENKGRSINLL